jgi:hypothetical protein
MNASECAFLRIQGEIGILDPQLRAAAGYAAHAAILG